MIHSETIVAIATGMNTSGIGIVRISGEDSFQIASEIFRTGSQKKLSEFESHHAYYGFIYDGQDLIDEVLLLPMKAPKSFTKEDTVEIDCPYDVGDIYMTKSERKPWDRWPGTTWY